jgi:hypothetical protein
MSLHKLSTEREMRSFPGASLNVVLDQPMGYVANAILRARTVQDCEVDPRNLPVFRRLRWSVREKLAFIFDDLALAPAFVSHRTGEGSLLLTAPGLLVHAQGASNTSYSSLWFSIWSESRSRVDEVIAQLEAIAGARLMRDESFTLDWRFTSADGSLTSASFQELADPNLLDEAYPSLGMSVEEFITRYLDANECVLVLLGPPGTGKTRLVRAILSAISRRKGENAEVMYTTDQRALKSDELFVEFITGSHDAFVIEDSDLLLTARTSGNEEMHRFLAIADGVARSQGRKIIFTTNLPNVNDIDDALVRPGRCYAVKNLRSLTLEEAQWLAEKICGEDAARAQRAKQALMALNAKSHSVANVYRLCA